MWAGATSMPALSVGRMTSAMDRPSARTSAIDRSTVLRLIPSPAVRSPGVHVDAQDPQPLLGQRTGEIDRRWSCRRRPSGWRSRSHWSPGHHLESSAGSTCRAVRQQRGCRHATPAHRSRTRWLSTRIGSCSPFRWITADRMMASVLAQRQAFAAEDRPCRRTGTLGAARAMRAESLLGGGQERIDSNMRAGS